MKTAAAPKAKPFLDRVDGLVHQLGMPPGVGRMIGWLMIAEPACQTPEEIARAVELPPDAVRAALDGLVTSETVDRVEMPEQAGPCYALRPIEALLERRVRQIDAMCELVDEALALPDQSAEVRERLTQFRAVYGQFEDVLRSLRRKPGAKAT